MLVVSATLLLWLTASLAYPGEIIGEGTAAILVKLFLLTGSLAILPAGRATYLAVMHARNWKIIFPLLAALPVFLAGCAFFYTLLLVTGFC
ncbi:MAG: hypothetical protein FD123_1497 [Bacteroidetes bacterium]|nr:MAG: hypothetical protein FD123_1497 [Bacteroidota bacterium]